MTMRSVLFALLASLGPAALPAKAADDSAVVVELFTSQGCSSCPPADALLHKLAGRDDVIALALHVDYWDYIGWEDSFAQPAFTARQKGYAHAAGRRSVYTPQMIIDGTYDVVGNRSMDVTAMIAREEAQPNPVAVALTRRENTLTIDLDAREVVGPVELHLVRYRSEAEVEIARGENAGHTLSYSQIVTDWDVVARWDGQGRYSTEVPVAGPSPIVVLVQKPQYGRVVGAAALR